MIVNAYLVQHLLEITHESRLKEADREKERARTTEKKHENLCAYYMYKIEWILHRKRLLLTFFSRRFIGICFHCIAANESL